MMRKYRFTGIVCSLLIFQVALGADREEQLENSTPKESTVEKVLLQNEFFCEFKTCNEGCDAIYRSVTQSLRIVNADKYHYSVDDIEAQFLAWIHAPSEHGSVMAIDLTERNAIVHSFIIEKTPDMQFYLWMNYVAKYSLKEFCLRHFTREVFFFSQMSTQALQNPYIQSLIEGIQESNRKDSRTIQTFIDRYGNRSLNCAQITEYLNTLTELFRAMKSNTDIELQNRLSTELFGVSMWSSTDMLDKYLFDPSKRDNNPFMAINIAEIFPGSH